MTSRQLAEVIDRFEDSAHDIGTARDGRLVKLIGNEVMFVAVDGSAACDIAGTLVERFAADPAVTPRGGARLGRVALSGRRLLRSDRQPGIPAGRHGHRGA